MKLKSILLAAVTLMQQAFGFSQTHPLVKYLPGDASMVMSINLSDLAHKISGESFRQSAIYRELMKNPGEELNAFFSDPSALGLDFSSAVFLVTVPDSTKEYPGISIHLFGLLKDEPLFANTMKKLAGDKSPINVYGTNKILFTSYDGPTLAWNKEIFVINVPTGRRSMMRDIYSATEDSVKVDMDKRIKAAAEMISKMQRNLCFELLTPHPQNSFSHNSSFINLLTTAGDIKIWNTGTLNPAFNKFNKILPIAGLASKLQALSGKNKTIVINFENGKITAQSKNYQSEMMASLYNKYPPVHLNTDLVRRLPKGKILGLVNISYNPEISKELMQQKDMKELAEGLKKMIPFDFSGINAAFKNNMMLAVIQSDEVLPGDSATQKMRGIQVILAMPIADKTKFSELKAAVSHIVDSLKNSEMGSKTFKDFDPAVRYNDSLFVISLSPDAATAFLNSNGSNSIPDWMQANTNHPILMSINLKEILGFAMGKLSPGKRGMEEQKFMNMFDQMIIYGGDYENGGLNSQMEFRFSNPNDNALKQLFDLVNMMAEQSGNSREKLRMENNENKKFTPPVILKDEEVEIPPPPPPPKKPVTKPKTKIKN